MDYNSNWPRWIMASAAKHFKPENIPYYVEGFERDTNGLAEWIEFRLDGPYIKEVTKGHWYLDIEINVMIMVCAGRNAYRTQEIQGIITEKFLDCLEIYKLGQTEPDDQSLLGCMKLQQKGRDRIIVTNFGIVKPEIKQLQSSIEAHYRMVLQ